MISSSYQNISHLFFKLEGRNQGRSQGGGHPPIAFETILVKEFNSDGMFRGGVRQTVVHSFIIIGIIICAKSDFS